MSTTMSSMNTKQQSSPQSADIAEIPVIDLSDLRSPLLEERKKLAGQIYDACANVGFFYIKVYTWCLLLSRLHLKRLIDRIDGRIMGFPKSSYQTFIPWPMTSSRSPMSRK